MSRFSNLDAARSESAKCHLNRIELSLQPLREKLQRHPLYDSIHTMEQLYSFMERHVFAVWDFMSLLKHLQSTFTCATPPWLPKPFPECGRLLNEIALAEETDEINGEYISHFDLYRRMMGQSGADTQGIDRFIDELETTSDLKAALRLPTLPGGVAEFVNVTFSFIQHGRIHEAAAAFTFGREDLIPNMFDRINQSLEAHFPNKLAGLRLYLERHIELDGDSHGPLALRMVSAICGDDPQLWQEATTAAAKALNARLALWDSIYSAVRSHASVTSRTAG